MKVTIKDVAKHLNISITTVSRALDNYADVSDETKRRVKAAAEELGYTPNLTARHLRKQRTDTIGYILPSERSKFNESFNAEFFAGLSEVVAKHNFDLLVSTAEYGSEREKTLYTNWVQGKKVDGFVINRLRVGDTRVKYLRQTATLFTSWEKDPADEGEFLGIRTDITREVETLITHLVNLGHSHIAYIGAKEDLVVDASRFKAFTSQLMKLGITPMPDLVERAGLSMEAGYAAVERLLDRSSVVSAIVCVNDNVALGALRALDDHGMKAGREILVSGFDGLPETAYSNPPLTTIELPVFDIAYQLGGMLIEQIDKNKVKQPELVLQPRLILRRSTG